MLQQQGRYTEALGMSAEEKSPNRWVQIIVFRVVDFLLLLCGTIFILAERSEPGFSLEQGDQAANGYPIVCEPA